VLAPDVSLVEVRDHRAVDLLERAVRRLLGPVQHRRQFDGFAVRRIEPRTLQQGRHPLVLHRELTLLVETVAEFGKAHAFPARGVRHVRAGLARDGVRFGVRTRVAGRFSPRGVPGGEPNP
jgi:hypothetical protein